MKRQRNLQTDFANYAVIVVADPYVASLDGLPNIDIMTTDLRLRKKKPSSTNELTRTDSNLNKLSNIEFTMSINKNTQTKSSKKVAKSESLQQLSYVQETRQKLMEEKRQGIDQRIDSETGYAKQTCKLT